MRRPSLNFIVDSLAFTGFVALTSSGILMHFVLPPGKGHGSTIWGLGRHDWGDVHFWIAVFFLGALALHLLLHWRWIVSMVRGRARDRGAAGFRVAAGLGAAVCLLVLAAAPLLSPVRQAPEAGAEETHRMEEATVRTSAAAPAAPDIRGFMTLADVEREAGVPVAHLLERLGLPADAPRDLPLRDLHNRYPFTMDDLRRVVQEYRAAR